MRLFKLTLMLAFLVLSSSTSVRPNEQIIVISHPDGPIYVGDQVSFEVLVPSETNDKTGSIEVRLADQKLGNAEFAPFGIGGRNQATLWWVWNTHDLKPGNYTLTFTRLPENKPWTETFKLHPADQVPSPEPNAHWVSTTTVCCNLYYITGTAADRDIAILNELVRA